MPTGVIVLFSGMVPLILVEALRLKGGKKGISEGFTPRGVGEIIEILARCREAARCDDPFLGRNMLDDCAAELFVVIPRVAPELALLAREHHASCLAAVKYRCGV